MNESGDPDGFNAAQWFVGWADMPLGALGGRLPADFLAAAEGRQLISGLLV